MLTKRIHTIVEPHLILIHEERSFWGTFLSKKDAKHMAKALNQRFRRFHHTGHCVVRNYGIDVHKVDPVTEFVLSWDKVPGYSVWEL